MYYDDVYFLVIVCIHTYMCIYMLRLKYSTQQTYSYLYVHPHNTYDVILSQSLVIKNYALQLRRRKPSVVAGPSSAAFRKLTPPPPCHMTPRPSWSTRLVEPKPSELCVPSSRRSSAGSRSCPSTWLGSTMHWLWG